MKISIENSVISSYKRLSYEPWYAFAEFVDNSTQAYFNNKVNLDRMYSLMGKRLTIKINYFKEQDLIVIEDNSIGMNENDLTNALRIGKPPEDPGGRSRYGLGMKTAACWFGNVWQIKTKKLGDTKGHLVTIDVDKISNDDDDLKHELFDAGTADHYTIIKITKLNREFKGRTLGKIKDFLSSMYRFDFKKYGLDLYWNGDKLNWEGFDDKLYVMADGSRYKLEFAFSINEKYVRGWVGVLGKGAGSRKNAGFSIVQNDRIIQGWPNAYKPISIFGDQEDGSNDLVNQRVIGELFLEGFSVSHTKDRIIWEGDEEDQLDSYLGEFCKDARELALTIRFSENNQNNALRKYKYEALTHLEQELKSNEIANFIRTVQPFPENIIKSSYGRSYENVIEDEGPTLSAEIGTDTDKIYVVIYFTEKSEFEPYVLTEVTLEENKVSVMINVLHPHFQEMSSTDSVLNFIRHCVYDGVSEWKCKKLRGEIYPYTIKFIKDGLLRIPIEIKTHQNS